MAQLDQSAVNESLDIARRACDAETPSVGVLKSPGSPLIELTLEYFSMPVNYRQRLKRVLMELAENPDTPLDKKMEAMGQLVKLNNFDDMRGRSKDKTKLALLRADREERAKTARARRPRAVELPPKDNALGIKP